MCESIITIFTWSCTSETLVRIFYFFCHLKWVITPAPFQSVPSPHTHTIAPFQVSCSLCNIFQYNNFKFSSPESYGIDYGELWAAHLVLLMNDKACAVYDMVQWEFLLDPHHAMYSKGMFTGIGLHYVIYNYIHTVTTAARIYTDLCSLPYLLLYEVLQHLWKLTGQ